MRSIAMVTLNSYDCYVVTFSQANRDGEDEMRYRPTKEEKKDPPDMFGVPDLSNILEDQETFKGEKAILVICWIACVGAGVGALLWMLIVTANSL
jgi:hypothetical protein